MMTSGVKSRKPARTRRGRSRVSHFRSPESRRGLRGSDKVVGEKACVYASTRTFTKLEKVLLCPKDDDSALLVSVIV